MAEEPPTHDRTSVSTARRARGGAATPLRSDLEEHPRRSSHQADPYGETGAKKVPNEKGTAADPVVGFSRAPVRSRTGDFQ